MSKVHFTLGPSASEAFAACAAKPTRERGLPNPSGEAAQWGTVAHDLSERKLLNQSLPTVAGATVLDDGTVVYGDDGPIALDDEMWTCVNTYCDLIESIPGDRFVEVVVPIDHITSEPGATGTSDAAIVDLENRRLTVADLKGGIGVRVDASVLVREDVDLLTGEITAVRRPNYQLGMYASGVLRALNLRGCITDVRLLIVQPRLNNFDEFWLTVVELDAHMADLRLRADATRQPNAPATPGEKQCHFCRAKGECPELRATALSAAIAAFPDLDDPQPREVPKDTLGEAMGLVPLVRRWCDGVEDALRRDLNAGIKHEGWKLVSGRMGHRRWKNGEAAQFVIELAGVDPFKRTLVTPAAIEAVLKKAQPETWATLKGMVEQPDGQPAMVPSTDPRPTVSSADCFTTLD